MSKNKKKRKLNKPLIIFSILSLIVLIIFIGFINSLNILPTKYMILLIVLLIVLYVLQFYLMKLKKKPFRIIGYILSILIIIISIAGIYYINETNNFLNKSFNNVVDNYSSTYYVLTLATSDIEEVEDVKSLADLNIGYFKSMPNINDAISVLSKDIDLKVVEYDEILSVISDMKSNKIDATVVEANVYESLTSEDVKALNKDDYKIIYKFDITVEIKDEQEEIIENTEEELIDDGNNITIYIGGVDFTEQNTDFNMVVVINKKTHKILLTSIPRDYYVSVPGTGMKELLGYVGYYGINTSKKAVANLLNTNIDYYIKINTESIVGLVDTLGKSTTFCSDKSFTTTHALILGSYDDSTGEKLYVEKGCKKYNGIEILTIARERKAFSDGDRQRQKNCQQIMINIFNQMLSAGNLANYSSVLNAVSNLYTTDLSRDVITELVKDTLNNGNNWKVETQSLTGGDSSGYVHMGTVKDYVMQPNQDSVNNASHKIKEIKAGK